MMLKVSVEALILCGGVLAVLIFAAGFIYGFREASDVWRGLRRGTTGVADHDLDAEEELMARRPLTPEQLRDCYDSNGERCPRCGDDADVEYEEPEDSEDDNCVTQSGQCGGCHEEWELVYRLAEVRPTASAVTTANNGTQS